MEDKKQCFKCLIFKPISNFYRHLGCADKHLNKCKECTRSDVKANREKKKDYYIEYDIKRGNKRGQRVLKESYRRDRINNSHSYKSFHGSDKEYRNLHNWVIKVLGKPSDCTSCKKNGLYGRKIHWANISNEYKKEESDWVRLCAQCHKKYDLLEIKN